MHKQDLWMMIAYAIYAMIMTILASQSLWFKPPPL